MAQQGGSYIENEKGERELVERTEPGDGVKIALDGETPVLVDGPPAKPEPEAAPAAVAPAARPAPASPTTPPAARPAPSEPAAAPASTKPAAPATQES